ncbi:hypothetical protein BDB00DRAFT_855983, partial [Zychaea mexicana]|uniref:uncharacterized protein n=1 Tax=Zychaea mexicana TaxID=64656 RepID=UPI0022FEB0FE
MAYYEADCEDLLCDEDDTTLNLLHDSDIDKSSLAARNTTTTITANRSNCMQYDERHDNDNVQQQQQQQEAIDTLMAVDDGVYDDADDSDDSEYSLDYEYLGPRNPNYRCQDDPDSDASELSDSDFNSNYQQQQITGTMTTATHSTTTTQTAGFDMWDEDPYSTNDYTWESNDMRLTYFIKIRQNELKQLFYLRSSSSSSPQSFWKKEKGWPKQLPSSCSTTNHDQAASALCLVQSNYGMAEQLYAVYRNRIFECGRGLRRATSGAGTTIGGARSGQFPLPADAANSATARSTKNH